MDRNDDAVQPSEPAPTQLPKTHIRAEISPLTKTTLIDDELVYWTDGDIININGLDSDALELDAPAQTTDFTFTGTAPSLPYKAVYPSVIYAGRTTVNLPHEQDYVSAADGTFAANGYDYMCAYSDEGNPVFQHLTCVVRITVKSTSGGTSASDIASVEFRGGAGEQVSGHFTLDHSGATLTSASSSYGDRVVGVYPSSPLSTSVERSFNISVPARTYASGFSIKITDSEGQFAIFTKSSSVSLYAGHIHPMSALSFSPGKEETEITLSSGSELNAFASAYNNGDYPYNANAPLVVRVTGDIALSAAEAAAFPGIGNATYPFRGTFDGQDHTISGFNTDIALFSYIENEGVVKNFTLSGAMTAQAVEWVNSGSYWQMLGTVCNYLKGTISHVTSSVDLTIASKTLDVPASSRYTVGGIAGIAVSTSLIEQSSYGGTITHASGFEEDFPRLLVGGILGQSNSNNVTVRGCTFGGAITLSPTSLSYSGTALWCIGGIHGYLYQGRVIACSSSGYVTLGVKEAYSSLKCHAGGVCGHITYQASLKNASYATGTVQVNMAGYPDDGELHIGGIAGYTELFFDGEGEINNSGTVKLAASTSSWDTSTSSFALGGIFGCLKRHNSSGTAISGLSNSGSVQYYDGTTTIAGHNMSMGGIIGLANGLSETVSLSECTNSAAVYFQTTAGSRYYKDICIAGILGDGSTPLSISHCSNSGYIHGGNSQNGRSSTDAAIYFAGIAGHLASTASASSSLSYCSNQGQVNNDEFNNVMTTPDTSDGVVTSYVKIPLTGGIIAFAEGCDGHPVTISHCEVSGIDGTGTSKNTGVIRSRRGVLGGIAGYARYASISDCTNTTSFKCYDGSTNAWHFGGGVCGIMNASSVSACSVSLLYVNSTQAKSFGGICSVMDTDSSISESTFAISTAPTRGTSGGQLNGNCSCGYAVGWTTVSAASLGVTYNSSSTWSIEKTGSSK